MSRNVYPSMYAQNIYLTHGQPLKDGTISIFCYSTCIWKNCKLNNRKHYISNCTSTNNTIDKYVLIKIKFTFLIPELIIREIFNIKYFKKNTPQFFNFIFHCFHCRSHILMFFLNKKNSSTATILNFF